MIQSCGVTVALPGKDFSALDREGKATVLRDAYAMLEQRVREHVGHVKPKGQPTFQVDGPHDDPLQGPIYVVSLAVPVETDDLPPTCTAYEAHHRNRRAAEGTL